MTLRAFHDHVRIGIKYQAVISTFITCKTSPTSNLKNKSSQRKEYEEGESDNDDKCRDAKKTKTKLIKSNFESFKESVLIISFNNFTKPKNFIAVLLIK